MHIYDQISNVVKLGGGFSANKFIKETITFSFYSTICLRLAASEVPRSKILLPKLTTFFL